MESSPWAVDWNPRFEDDQRVKHVVLRSLGEENVMNTVHRLAKQSIKEVEEAGVETEHLVWLDAGSSFAFFVRIWFEPSEETLFVIVEENDLGDVAFLHLEDHECASYEGKKVLEVRFEDPETLGVEP